MILLQACALSKDYKIKTGLKPILKEISFAIKEGESLALLGRSGCGKSTLMRLLMGLESPDKGEIFFKEKKFSEMKKADKREFYQNVQLIFQDSLSAVNPRFSVEKIIAEPLNYLSSLNAAEKISRIKTLLQMVDLPEDFQTRLPFQLSGGQLQRVCIARALALEPKLLLLDEAVSNLDIHLQVETLNLLKKLQKEQGISYLFVTHDFRLVKKFSDQILVMDQGEIVEKIDARKIALHHPASFQLWEAILPPFPKTYSRLS
ncbi:nickel import ATP-binding protein NikE [Acetobacteraceae bacterium]|nr:nickel import ATP-binding protein NikE [Acetobacteraceae bacterium]